MARSDSTPSIKTVGVIGGDRPHGVPANAQLIDLPYSEVCMHLRLAGRLRWVAPVDHGMAQIYDEHGRPFSAPILRSEAGLDDRTDPDVSATAHRVHHPCRS